MSRLESSDTMPKLGQVTDLREQWLVRTDGALAHRLQDREISTHLCENRYRNQLIREDFPVALSEQRGIEHELRLHEVSRRRQAEIDAEIARKMAEVNIHKKQQARASAQQPCSSRSIAPHSDIDSDELGLSAIEIEEMRRRLEQEERDARLAHQLSHEVAGQDALLADMRCAVEAQDGELARLLQEREYKKLQRAKERARQKALLKKQQKMAQQEPQPSLATLCDAYSNPRDIIRQNATRLCKSVESDLHYVEPFEKECIQSKASALQFKEISKQYYSQEAGTSRSNLNISHSHTSSYDSNRPNMSSVYHREPPPPPSTGKKPRFPDPISIRPASHYPTDNILPSNESTTLSHSVSENNNLYSSSFPCESQLPQRTYDIGGPTKRFSVISDITAEDLAKKKSKADMHKKRRGCKIQ
ncbi:coiled-coil domain-containing protein 50 [Leptidea sinapis]|uniref:Coiled-coil domain-containing protein n=1 Tax=Leptidea sinapis TaxID=189913 RepID=A0A5E4QJ28_9NEOP|nr:coiled-coil domain-containing protein 50 [Leptidea sinapis]VVC97907.1 unnamed protein product [Leptidea sinapis]